MPNQELYQAHPAQNTASIPVPWAPSTVPGLWVHISSRSHPVMVHPVWQQLGCIHHTHPHHADPSLRTHTPLLDCLPAGCCSVLVSRGSGWLFCLLGEGFPAANQRTGQQRGLRAVENWPSDGSSSQTAALDMIRVIAVSLSQWAYGKPFTK